MAVTDRIENVESVVMGDLHYVFLTDSSGREGVGQSACWAFPDATDSVTEVFARGLLGEDASNIERLWHLMFRMAPFRSAISSAAMSAVDQALWDLAGKRLHAPVMDLLGGRTRDRVRLHLLITEWTDRDDLVTQVEGAVQQGFTAVKFNPLPRDYAQSTASEQVNGAINTVQAVRQSVGNEVDLILELHRSWSPATARVALDAFVPFRPLFVEDALQIDSLSEQSRVAQHSVLPVGHGERFHSIWEFRELFEQGGPQFVRADVGLAGGISGCKKIAALAESWSSRVTWHNWMGPVLAAATANLDFTLPNTETHEWFPSLAEDVAGVTTAFAREGGWLVAGDFEGLGVGVDRTQLEPVRLLDRALHEIPRRPDGSWAFSV